MHIHVTMFFVSNFYLDVMRITLLMRMLRGVFGS